MKRLIVALCVAVSLAACYRGPLNPPRLVMSDDTDMSIQLFMQATILMANYYGYDTIDYQTIQDRSARAGFSTLPFMPPETVRATPNLVNFQNAVNSAQAQGVRQWVKDHGGYNTLVKYYVNTGWRASQLICRNYLLGLNEKNQYLEFLRKEFGVGYTLATGILAAVQANGTLSNAFSISRSFVDGVITNYEEYRFLNVDRESARALVETSQAKYAAYFADQINKAPNTAAGGYSFSDALNAVSVIEYQCTREGITFLINRSINNSPTNLEIDDSGNLMFKTASLAMPCTGTDKQNCPVVGANGGRMMVTGTGSGGGGNRSSGGGGSGGGNVSQGGTGSGGRNVSQGGTGSSSDGASQKQKQSALEKQTPQETPPSLQQTDIRAMIFTKGVANPPDPDVATYLDQLLTPIKIVDYNSLVDAREFATIRPQIRTCLINRLTSPCLAGSLSDAMNADYIQGQLHSTPGLRTYVQKLVGNDVKLGDLSNKYEPKYQKLRAPVAECIRSFAQSPCTKLPN